MTRLLLTASLLAVLLGGSRAVAEVESILPVVRGVTLANMGGWGDGGYGSEVCRQQLDELAKLGCNWVALTEHIYMEDVRRPEMRWREGRGEQLKQTVADAHARGIQVLFKPHIWSRQFGRGGEWHGTVAMQTEADWAAFFQNYGDFLVEHARIAQEAGADAFCVGTELLATSHRAEDWRRVVARVRAVYDGALTYAAHNDEWERIEWWGEVDCVGVNAYFPLTQAERPTERELREAWRAIHARLKVFGEQTGRPIVFTELGYTASANAARAPWEAHEVDPDHERQALLYRVALEELERAGAVHGVLLWKWFTADVQAVTRRGGGDPFGLQGRPAVLAVLFEQWGSAPNAGGKQ